MKHVGPCEDCGRKVYIDKNSRCKKCRIGFTAPSEDAEE